MVFLSALLDIRKLFRVVIIMWILLDIRELFRVVIIVWILLDIRELFRVVIIVCVVFLSCPLVLVKKHADLSGSFLYSQSTMKDMYSKPTNRTELSIPMKTKSIA